MKKGFSHENDRRFSLHMLRRVAALVLALLMMLPANLATVLAEAVQGEPAPAPVCGKQEHVHTDACYESVLICGQEEREPGTRSERVYVGALKPHRHTDECRDKDGKLICGIAEGEYYHVHNQYCRDDAGKLVCGLEEKEPHEHTDACYEERDKLVCELEESEGHQHTDACYETTKELTCGQEESEGHKHTDACYTTTKELTCGQEESEGHRHTDACYTYELTCGQEEGEDHQHTEACYTPVLTCGQAESEGHTHTDACYTETRELTCGQEESEGHKHSDACYTEDQKLICDVEAGAGAHKHDKSCYETERVLTCTEGEPQVIDGVTFEIQTLTSSASDWETREVEDEGHTHTDACYEAQPVCGLEEHTHTEACYDEAQGDDEIEEETTSSDSADAQKPSPSGEGGSADALTEEVVPQDETQGETETEEETTSSDSADAEPASQGSADPISLESVHRTDSQALDAPEGEATGEEATGEEEAPAEEETAPEGEASGNEEAAPSTVSLSESDISVSEITGAALADLVSLIDTPARGGLKRGPLMAAANGSYTGYAAFEIDLENAQLEDADGYVVPVSLAAPIDMLQDKARPEATTETDGVALALYHIVVDAEGNRRAEQVALADEQVEGSLLKGFTFETDGFSSYVLKYTVRFHYAGRAFTCELPGAKDVPLSQILDALGIAADAAFMANLEAVSASDPEAIRLEAVEGDWTFRALRQTEGQSVLTLRTRDGVEFTVDVAVSGVTEAATEDESAVIRTLNAMYLPEGEKARAEVIPGEDAIAAVREKAPDAEYRVFDIGLESADAADYEGFEVEVNLADRLAGRDYKLYQVKDGEAEDVTGALTLNAEAGADGLQSVSGFGFTTDDFAQFVLCYTLETYYKAFDGATFKIELNYGPEAEIPHDAELKVREILPADAEYADYLLRASRAAAVAEGEEALASYGRFFDIEILSGGEKVEPKAAVTVDIALADAPAEELKVVHFDEAEGPVVMAAQVAGGDEADATTEIRFEAGSFSVYGVITVPHAPTGVNDLDGQVVTIKNGNYYLTAKRFRNNGQNLLEASTEENDAAAWHFEAVGQPGQYYIYTEVDGNKRYMQMTQMDSLHWTAHTTLGDDPQAFTVANPNGEYYTISTVSGDAEPKTYYLNNDASLGNNVHGYRGRDDASLEGTHLSFTFSQTTKPIDQYMLVTEYNNEIYIVLNDGRLEKAESDLYGNPIGADFTTPMTWTWDGSHLYHNSLAVGYTGDQRASDYYRRYIDPKSDTGLTQEHGEYDDGTAADPESVAKETYNIAYVTVAPKDQKYKTVTSRTRALNDTAFNIVGNTQFKITDDGKYLGVKEDANGNLSLSGNKGDGEAANFWFADANQVSGEGYITLEKVTKPVNGEQYYVVIKGPWSVYYIVNPDRSLSAGSTGQYDTRIVFATPDQAIPMWTYRGSEGACQVFSSGNYLNPYNGAGITTSEARDGSNNQLVVDNDAGSEFNNGQVRGRGPKFFKIENNQICGDKGANDRNEVFLARLVSANDMDYINSTLAERQHMVNHIDISIEGLTELTVPLAYGTYQYIDPSDNQMHKFTVSTNTNLNLKQKVGITEDDIKKGTIEAYVKNDDGSITYKDNLFTITGYSANEKTAYSTDQVRIEGNFKVADLAPVDSSQANSDETRAARLANKVYYTVSVTKPVTFLFTDKDRGQIYDIDGNPMSITLDMNFSASFNYWDWNGVGAEHNNECPPLQPGSNAPTVNGKDATAYVAHYTSEFVKWQGAPCKDGKLIDPNGNVIYHWKRNDTNPPDGYARYCSDPECGSHLSDWEAVKSYPTAGGIAGWGNSGMDFVLGGDAGDADAKVVALNITKKVVDKQGNLISVDSDKTPVNSVFDVYYYRDGEEDNVAVANAGDNAVWNDATQSWQVKHNSTDGFYGNDYNKLHSKTIKIGSAGMGLIYDYSVAPGMFYIEESHTEEDLPQEILDTKGQKWEYVKTYIETEYVWRDANDKDDMRHVTGDYTREIIEPQVDPDRPDEVPETTRVREPYRSIPDVLGEYHRPDGSDVDNDGNKLRNGFLMFYVYNVYEPEPINIKVEKSWEWQNDSDKPNVPNEASVDVTLGRYKLEPIAGYKPKGKLTITDSYTGIDSGYDAMYAVIYPDGTRVEKNYADGYNGSIVLTDLKGGQYVVTKVVPGKDGYAIQNDSEKIFVDVPANGNGTAEFKQTQYTRIDNEDDWVTVGLRISYPFGEDRSNPDAITNINAVKKVRKNSSVQFTYNPIWVVNAQNGQTYQAEPQWMVYEWKATAYEGEHWEANYEQHACPKGALQTVQVGEYDTCIMILFDDENAASSMSIRFEAGSGSKAARMSAPRMSGTVSKEQTNAQSAPDSSIEGMQYVPEAGWQKTVTLNNENEWAGWLEENGKKLALEEYDENGNKYVYYISKVQERNVPEGTQIVIGSDYTAEVDKAARTVIYTFNVTNKLPDKARVRVKKVSSEDKTTLLNAKFDLMKQDGEAYTKVGEITVTNGYSEYFEVSRGHYKLVETEVQSGYINTGATPEFDVAQSANGVIEVTYNSVALTDSDIVVENPPETEKPHKKEIGLNIGETNAISGEGTAYYGIGELGAVKVGDLITYEISYKNYKTEKADVVIKDQLDANVDYDSCSDGGVYTNRTTQTADGKSHIVTWTLKDVEPGAEGTVTLTVSVLKSALKSNGGAGEVVNGGDTATVKVGNDNEFTLEEVKNPVPEEPHKQEIVPYTGTGVLGGVQVGDEITYEISYKNYKTDKADVKIKDTLDPNVEFVEASDSGVHDADKHIVNWTLKNVEPGAEGTVTLKVKVLKGALKSEGGAGEVVNGGDTATVQVGNDQEYSLEVVKNPVPDEPHKKETDPYEGIGVLGGVHVGDEITYEISYLNYKTEKVDIKIKDTLDKNVEFVSASDGGTCTNGVVNWTLTGVDIGKSDKVTLKVRVLKGALESNGGPGKVVNGGDGTTVKVGNDNEFTLEKVENPVPEEPKKEETKPYEGTGVLGAVKVGDLITYKISYKNYKADPADVVIKDQLDPNVDYDSCSNSGVYTDRNTQTADGKSHIVTWTLKNVPAGASGTVTLTVVVLEGALVSENGPGKVVNGGKTATVKVGNDNEFTLNEVENPVPEEPHKKEIGLNDLLNDPNSAYYGTGVLGGVHVGDIITYEISFRNYKAKAADVKIKDTLDKNVEFVEASDNGTLTDGVVYWTLKDFPANTDGKVTLRVKVLEGALVSENGPGKVVNGGDSATVQVGDDQEYTLEEVENPVPEEPKKEETAPYEGTGVLGAVKVGDEITYKITYRNYKNDTADVVIKDTLDKNVAFVSASDSGVHQNGIVTWTLKNVEKGKEGTVTLTVEVLEGALESNGGDGKVVNGGDTATVKVGNDSEFTLDVVENPVPEEPHKREIEPDVGTGTLCGVNVGDEITYEISFINYKDDPATIRIKDTLDKNVEFVEASDDGTLTNGVVYWTLKDFPANTDGTVTLKVKVLEGALVSKNGPGKVVNGGETATVRVGNDQEYTLEVVENPIPEKPEKKEIAPYEGTGVLGAVKVGDEITYQITYKNYMTEAADVKIKDTLDKNVEFVSASNGGTLTDGVVYWTVTGVEPGKAGTVTLTVKVLEGALESNGGDGEVVNGGDTATVKVGNDSEYKLEVVTNPVPEVPHKKETAPYEGAGVLGAVNVGDEITYQISFINYKAEAATIRIKDTLDPNVEFVSANKEGTLKDGVVYWTLENYPANTAGTVTLTVRVLKGALKSNGGPAKVVNGGESATVKVGNDNEFSLEVVENPVPEGPEKKEIVPYEGTGVLGAVKVGDEITYQISYRNYKNEAADVLIKDTLDRNVEFVSASNGGVHDADKHIVNWTVKNVPAGETGTVTLKVKVLKGALVSQNGQGKVVNGGDGATVKVGNDSEYKLNEVENPVPENPHKKETDPYDGTGVLGAVKVGDTITYQISFRNYKAEAADVKIKDTLDKNVEFVSASNGGVHDVDKHIVNWTVKNVPAGETGTVTLKVLVLEGALKSKEGPGKVVNGGDSATVQVGNDQEYTLEEVENPVPEVPNKKEITPYEGTGRLGTVFVGDEITYEISFINYKDKAATVKIKDTLDAHVKFVSASDGGTHGGEENGGVVNWTLKDVPVGPGKVTLKVLVLPSALVSKNGPGKVVNGGKTATVQVDNDKEYTLEVVENPVDDVPGKKEIDPYEGTGVLGAVQVGDVITYQISYRNYKTVPADIGIKDTLDEHVEFVSASDGGVYDKDNHVVNWTLSRVAVGKNGTVTLQVKVLPSALVSENGPGEVVNGGDGTTVKVGNDKEVSLEEVTNPVPENPHKQETKPYEGIGELGAVKVGELITYEISYKNYKDETVDIKIKDTLDTNVKFEYASDGGVYDEGEHIVNWTLKNVPAGKASKVTLQVRVLEGALQSKGGPGKVVNGGDSATVKVGNDKEFTLEYVENPVPENPRKQETKPYAGTGVLGAVKVGDTITYEISYRNYKSKKADVVIKDQLDKYVDYVDCSNNGVYTDRNTQTADGKSHIVTWTLKDVEPGAEGTVTLQVLVLEGALKSKEGPGKVVNGGKTATVQVGNDQEYTLEEVENPVPEVPHKQEIGLNNLLNDKDSAYYGTGMLGAVQVGDEITYEISFRNYKAEAADVRIKDTLDANVEFVKASDGGVYDEAKHIVNWTVKDVPAGEKGTVTLKVLVLKSALKSEGGKGEVVNGGDTATVQVGNDQEYTLDVVENPVPEEPHKKETAPYEGTGVLGAVKVGDSITYEISYRNYKADKADVKIKDTLDENVKFVEASDGGELKDGVVYWTLKDVAAGADGTVTLKVLVLEGALKSNGGKGKVVNGGDSATVQVGNDKEFTLEVVENPVPEEPHKKEIAPYEGTGVLGAVKVGDIITYEISYRNYKTDKADVKIKDTLDVNVGFVSASDGGALKDGVVYWTLKDVAAGKEGTVTLKVKVLEGALKSEGGKGKVVNGGDTATVQVGNDQEYTLDVVENPVPEEPHKKETAPYEGTGVLGAVKVGDIITYEISYKNYKTDKADVKIKDTLDKNVGFVSASDGGALKNGVVTWTLKDVAAGKEGTVTLKVKVLEGALKSNGGKGKVVNGGDSATVQVGNDQEYTLDVVENPVPEEPHKQETAPYEGTGVLGAVKVGDSITYEISYRNYKADKADVKIKDTLDENVKFVEASDGGELKDGVVTWTLKDVAAGKEGTVTLKVKVLEGALKSEGGKGEVVNGGDSATVQVGNDQEYTLDVVENPVPEEPHKKETAPYEGTGVLGAVKVGDSITYEISYRNYKADKADVKIKDTLDENVKFVEASDGGELKDGVVTWTLKDVAAGKEGTVTLKVKVLEGALKSEGGKGKVVNGGDSATVKVGNDKEFTLEVVENPVPEEPHKKEIAPYEGTGVLGAVKVGDVITYEISYRNYKADKADVKIKDTLDENVKFVEASDGGALKDGVVTWTLKDVAAGKEGTVTLKVKVLEGALVSQKGPGKVVNGGDTATVQVGNDQEYTLDVVENPVPEEPHKQETAPYEGTGVLGAVKVGDIITYEISYRNYKTDKADVKIKDTLDVNVGFVSASDGGALKNGVVTWTLKDVAAGKEGTVTLKVKVLEGALKSEGGKGEVVNGGDTATVQVGNDQEYTLDVVENPVPEEPHKKEIAPYEGTGVLGAVKVGDIITYEISYRNYKTDKADVKIKDTLDVNVEFVEASDGGALKNGVVTWTLKDVAAGKDGTVTLKVKVLAGALKSKKGPGKVVNGGDSATVQVGNDDEYTLDVVENPVPETQTPEPTATPAPTATPNNGGQTPREPGVTPKPTVTITGNKVWVDDGNARGLRPESVTVRLLADGTPVDAEPKWSDTDTDNWTFTFRNLPAVTDAGIEINYTVQEEPVRYYKAEISGTTITNRLTPETPKDYLNLSGTKTWVDDDDALGLRPESITLKLLCNGVVVQTKQVTAADDWKYSFDNLPTDDGLGVDYTYRIRENGVEGYFTQYDGNDVTNTLLPNQVPNKNDGTPPQGDIPKGVVNVDNRKTGTPLPPFSDLTEPEYEELFDVFGYNTPLWGIMKTGDETPAWPWAFGGIGALALIALAVLNRKRRRA